LKVLGQRGDGFHEIETIFQSISLADEIEIEARPSDLTVDMSIEAGPGHVPAMEENLAHKAACRLLEELPDPLGAHLRIRKRIPIAAGLGGGSANAAGAVLALAKLWNLDLDTLTLEKIAAELGSDVPFCLSGGTSLASGRGEILTSLPGGSEIWFVLGISDQPLLTSEVYAAHADVRTNDGAKSAPMVLALGGGDVGQVAELLHNDLEAAIFRLRPELPAKKEALLAAGALGALVSGSGPTVFGVLPDRDSAEAVAMKVSEVFDRVEVADARSSCVDWSA
jgi:4-diphosphocytidyl-2-C-methyl-D-erythritol kinase